MTQVAKTVTVISPVSYPVVLEGATKDLDAHLKRVKGDCDKLNTHEVAVFQVYHATAQNMFQSLTMLLLSNSIKPDELVPTVTRIKNNVAGSMTRIGEHDKLAVHAAELAVVNIILKNLGA